jgi:hypothetical protein
VTDVSEPAGVDSGVLPPRFRERTWPVDLLAAAVILLTVRATPDTALGLSSSTGVALWLVAAPITTQIRPLAARFNSSSTDTRSTCSCAGSGGYSSAADVTQAAPVEGQLAATIN